MFINKFLMFILAVIPIINLASVEAQTELYSETMMTGLLTNHWASPNDLTKNFAEENIV